MIYACHQTKWKTQLGLDNKMKDTEELTETVEITEDINEEQEISEEVCFALGSTSNLWLIISSLSD